MKMAFRLWPKSKTASELETLKSDVENILTKIFPGLDRTMESHRLIVFQQILTSRESAEARGCRCNGFKRVPDRQKGQRAAVAVSD